MELAKIMMVMLAIAVACAFVGHLIHNTNAGKKWISGLALVYIIACHGIFSAVCVLFLSIVPAVIIGPLFTTGEWALYTTMTITALIYVPIYFAEFFDGAYSDWKARSNPPQAEENNRTSSQ